MMIALFTFCWPGATVFFLLSLMAAWAILTGILEILAAIELSLEISNERFLVLSGIVSLIFGMIIILFPEAGALDIAWLAAVYAIIFGVIILALSIKIRRLRGSISGHEPITN